MSYSIEVGSMGVLIITPKLVEQIALDSLDLGWKPKENGKPAQLTFLDGELKIRRGIKSV